MSLEVMVSKIALDFVPAKVRVGGSGTTPAVLRDRRSWQGFCLSA
jgi:hypothetical protein